MSAQVPNEGASIEIESIMCLRGVALAIVFVEAPGASAHRCLLSHINLGNIQWRFAAQAPAAEAYQLFGGERGALNTFLKLAGPPYTLQVASRDIVSL